MNEGLDQSEESQDHLNEEQEKSDSNQNQLLEIYKLHAQLADNISNRRAAIHKFYLLLMSGLALILPTFFKLPTEIRNQVSIEFLMIGVALLGIPLCLAWLILIYANLRMSMLKYETLKKLEGKLKYPFFKEEGKLLKNYGKGKAYGEISYIEIFIPIFFFLIFTFFLNAVQVNYKGKFYFQLLTIFPTIIGGFFLGYGSQLWKIDRHIRGIEQWSEKRINLFSCAIIVIYILTITLFRLEYQAAVNKEAETIDKKLSETTLEQPAETDSEEVTNEQNDSQ